VFLDKISYICKMKLVSLKIAVPTRDGVVDDHFGHCAYYTVYTVVNQIIVGSETLPSPQGCGCKSNIASVLEDMGVKVMLAGNMGQGAKNVLENHNIAIVRGCSGPVDEQIKNYHEGRVADSGDGCHHHECQG
jgi:predicted Fe-Mo cluster-binding NifX family protein